MKFICIRYIGCIIVVTMLLTASVPAFAERMPVVQWLMNEPVSMWDFGLSELRNLLDHAWEKDNSLGIASRNARYDQDRNLIVIEFFLFKPFNKELCGIMLRESRRQGRIKADGTPYPWHRENYSIYAGSFSRVVPKGNEPDNYLRQIDQIIEVEVIMDGGSCKGPLISSEVLYGE